MASTMLYCVAGVCFFAGLYIFTGCGKSETVTEVSVMENISDNEEAAEISESAGAPVKNAEEVQVCVHVLGAVVKPGVYELSEGSRVVDAIKAAGGFTEVANQTWLNQARVLADGEQVYVPTQEEVIKLQEEGGVSWAENRDDGSNWTDSSKSGKVNINQAGPEELMTLPGIGESKAESIISYRQQVGKFTSIEELMNIPGIKEGVYNKIKDLITI